jgi:hypothetical protein
MRERVLVALALLVLSLAPQEARADALGPPPTCEVGFQGLMPRTHGEHRCEPLRCRHESDCSPRPGMPYAASCQAAGLCMVSGAATTTCDHVGASCGEAAARGRCVAARLCTPITPALPPGVDSALPPRHATDALAFGAPIFCVGLVMWDLRRKRR